MTSGKYKKGWSPASRKKRKATYEAKKRASLRQQSAFVELPLDAIPDREPPRARKAITKGKTPWWGDDVNATLVLGGLTFTGTLGEVRALINGRAS